MYTFKFEANDDMDYGTTEDIFKDQPSLAMRTLTDELEFHSSARWHEVIKSFVLFLGAFYGYNIADKIAFVEKDSRGNTDYVLISDSCV